MNVVINREAYEIDIILVIRINQNYLLAHIKTTTKIDFNLNSLNILFVYCTEYSMK